MDLKKYLNENLDAGSVENEIFEVTSSVSPQQETVFKNCRFHLFKGSNLLAGKIHFNNCSFIGEEELFNYVNTLNLQLSNSSLLNCNLSGSIRSVRFDTCILNNFKDTSITTNYALTNDSRIHNFTILGECENLNLDSAVFNSAKHRGIWNKKITKNARCKKTIFDNSEVNPFYFATKCDDKSSLDLSSARLTDDWSRLRKNYAGISLFIVLFLSLLFFLPMITHSFFLLLASNVDILVLEKDKITLAESLLFGGKEGLEALFYFGFTWALVIYNGMRIWMTISIAKLREEEKFLSDANFQLVSIHPDKYKVQLKVEKVLKFLFWISIFYSMLKLKDTLMIEVPNFK